MIDTSLWTRDFSHLDYYGGYLDIIVKSRWMKLQVNTPDGISKVHDVEVVALEVRHNNNIVETLNVSDWSDELIDYLIKNLIFKYAK